MLTLATRWARGPLCSAPHLAGWRGVFALHGECQTTWTLRPLGSPLPPGAPGLLRAEDGAPTARVPAADLALVVGRACLVSSRAGLAGGAP